MATSSTPLKKVAQTTCSAHPTALCHLCNRPSVCNMNNENKSAHREDVDTRSIEKAQLEHLENEHEDTLSPFGSPDSLESKAAERRIVRKLDMTLLPMVWVLYMFNYLDRNNIAYGTIPFTSVFASG